MLLQNNRTGSMLSISKTSGTRSRSNSAANDETDDPFAGLSFSVGVAENKNVTYRSKMEDVHTYVANFAEKLDWGYFAIFDGHAGKLSGCWGGRDLHTILEQEILPGELSTTASPLDPEDNDLDVSDLPTPQKDRLDPPVLSDMQENLYQAFLRADTLNEKEGNGLSGSTAAVAVLRWEANRHSPQEKPEQLQSKTEKKNHPYDFVPTNHKRVLYTSNVGDLRIVLCRLGHPYRLSYDHKATDLNEIERIKNARGLVMKNRVNGVLAVSRSLGDSYMKDLVIGVPFTTATEITQNDEFMILACDGVWDVISDAAACKTVSQVLHESNNNAQLAALRLCQQAIDNSTTDNVTVMVVRFHSGVFNC